MAKKRTKARTIKRNGGLIARPVIPRSLLRDLREMIATSRHDVAQTVNSSLVGLYWGIGRRIGQNILNDRRAEYGEKIVSSIAAQLTVEFGRGFDRRNLFHMVRFAQVFPDEQIVNALRTQLSWTHFRELIAIEDPLKREFYTEICRIERWSTRTLQSQIGRLLFERTAVSKKPAKVIQNELTDLRTNDQTSPDLVFRDPYLLDFLGLPSRFMERDFEQAILNELESFILELGSDFAFVARQKRITVDGDDYYIDLLFFHRRLRRLVAIDLKLGRFQAADKGQMELYLRWLEKYEVQSGEDPPVGLILCAGKSDEHIELLQLARSGIRVAAYLTELPPRAILKRKLHDAVKLAQKKLLSDEDDGA